MLTTPFSIPSHCNQSVSAGKCRASLAFTYGVADYTINCYDSNENERQCGTLAQRGSCVISHNIFQDKIDRSCDDKMLSSLVSVNIIQSPSSATFIVYCNQALCNTNSTLQKVKDIMFQYNVTATSDGRLIDVEYVGNYESKLMISIPLMIMIIFGLLSN
ncbi:unnamed protein product [Rotaria sp. Silwood1]|nr:unnamed protein product [Rotaria sp. Silwood1]CAF1628439.1 unnamed protein product [Rotaria sp. Silwood1]CAF4762257.1 unnamed protein product [Rotaria sp. Silwood1]